jgi:pimeloyl-ACP methyl ester carboxylesterase
MLYLYTLANQPQMFNLITTIIFEIILLLLAPLAITIRYCTKNTTYFDTKHDHNKKTILLVHGSGFNQSEWIMGYLWLRRKHNIYALDNAGLISNGDNESILDYVEKVRNKIEKIKYETGTKKITLIGHSMGGLIVSHYFEFFSSIDNTDVEKVILIGSPVDGSPVLNIYKKYLALAQRFIVLLQRYFVLPQRCIVLAQRYFVLPQRYIEMSEGSEFLKKLKNKIYLTDSNKYITFATTGDFFVPPNSAHLCGRNNITFNYCGHYSIICNPFLWYAISKIL